MNYQQKTEGLIALRLFIFNAGEDLHHTDHSSCQHILTSLLLRFNEVGGVEPLPQLMNV